MAKSTVDQKFTQQWNKTANWAQASGIPSTDYLPVYQLDASRLGSGYPMSPAERHVAILAAQNPNNVPSAPTDNPHPSAVFDNVRHDLGMIATGLEPTHLISGLFGTVENTVKAIVDPGKEEGKSLGITAANWLQNTLLSFVPGAYDLGAFLRADTHGGTAAGFAALADHPLLSLLDVMPADGAGPLLMKGAVGIGLGETVARAAGMSTDALKSSTVTQVISKALMNQTWGMKAGYSLDASLGLHDLTVAETIQNWASNSVLGTSKPVRALLSAYVADNQVLKAVNQAMIAPMVDAVKGLTGEGEIEKYQEIFQKHQTEHKSIGELLSDPKVTPKVKAAVEETLHVRQWLSDHAIAENQVVGILRPDGSVGIYATEGANAAVVEKALGQKKEALDHFLKQLEPEDRDIQWLTRSNTALATLAKGIDKGRSDALTSFGKDKDRLENVKQTHTPDGAKKPVTSVVSTRKETVDRIFGPSGMVDQVVQAMKDNDLDALATRLPGLKRALAKEWKHSAVDVLSNPHFAEVAKMVDALDGLVKQRIKVYQQIERRITGEYARRVTESKLATKQMRAERKEMVDRHKEEQRELQQRKRMSKAQVKTARKQRMKDLDDLYERQKDAALARWDNVAARATKAQADEAFKMYKQEEAKLRGLWWESKNRENKRYDRMELQGQLDIAKEYPDLIKRQTRELKELDEQQKLWGMFHGSLVDEYRYYKEALDKFNQAVWNHPSDNYVSMEVKLLQDHLFENEKNAELVDLHEEHLKNVYKGDESRVDALHKNPQLMKELLWTFTNDVYKHPENFPALMITEDTKNLAQSLIEEVRNEGLDELHKLMAEGFNPLWLPRAGALDETIRNPHFGVTSGTPHVDVAHERVRDVTATRHDVVLGVTRAMGQALKRDAYIDFVEHNLTPMTIDGQKFAEQMMAAYPDDPAMRFENLDTTQGTGKAALSKAARDHGLEEFDPKSIFPFLPPRWEGKTLFIPEGLTKSLKKTIEVMDKGDRGLLDKPTQIFRYSILGLSPRYTAHILFGGTFLLALRSTAYMPLMLKDALKGLKNGDFNARMFRDPTQLGLSKMEYAANEWGIEAGKQLVTLNVQEHIAKVQGVLLSKASPLHYLKALADLNFKFTSFITRLQSAVAYLDHSRAAERRGSFIDADGKEIQMTPERAQEEGLRHVEQVFGDLRSMSPLERQIAKNVLPFYGWTRHILKYVMTYPFDHPARAMILALIAYENSAEVPKGLPERIQNLFFLGSPDKNGNVTAIDARFLNPLRDVANYATLGGWIQGLNPVLLAPMAMMDPQLVYGSTSLYPNLTFNDMYGIETAGAQGNAVTGLEQFVPQLGAVTPITQALSKAANVRKLASDPNAFYKSIFNDLNIPFAQVQKVNVKQIAAKDAIARLQVAKSAATTAFQTGDFSTLAGYKTVPYPLNADYEVTPAQLKAIYDQALAEYPGQQPANVLLAPPTPANY